MPYSDLKFVKRFAEFQSRTEIKKIPPNTRGIYALLKHHPRLEKFDVVYIGMAGGKAAGIHSRLKNHARSKSKCNLWTHFSVFEVMDHLKRDEILELEGLFRQIYWKDKRANKLNKQKQFSKLKNVKVNEISNWD